jgi:hypothetical protein
MKSMSVFTHDFEQGVSPKAFLGGIVPSLIPSALPELSLCHDPQQKGWEQNDEQEGGDS